MDAIGRRVRTYDGSGMSDRAAILARTIGPSWSASRKTCRTAPMDSRVRLRCQGAIAFTPQYTLNPLRFLNRSHAWNRGSITQSNGPTRCVTRPVSYDFRKIATQSFG